jgi:hypothetical protein
MNLRVLKDFARSAVQFIRFRVLTTGIFKRFVALLFPVCLISGCATTQQHRAYSDTSALVLGKTTIAECRVLYGEPKETDSQSSAGGRTEVFRYGEASERWTKMCVRLLAVEFKDGILNGFVFVSSYPEDRTSYALTNLTQVEWGVSTKDEVTELLGKPHGRFLCPTTLFDGNCKITGREVWVFTNLQPIPILTSAGHMFSLPIDLTTITFDQHGLAMDITKKEGYHF